MISFLKGFAMLALAVSAHAAMAAEDASRQSSEVLGGFLILLGVVVVAYLFVFLLRALAGGEKRAGRLRDMDSIEFAKSTTSTDRPSIER
jgi:hypothetical protein